MNRIPLLLKYLQRAGLRLLRAIAVFPSDVESDAAGDGPVMKGLAGPMEEDLAQIMKGVLRGGYSMSMRYHHTSSGDFGGRGGFPSSILQEEAGDFQSFLPEKNPLIFSSRNCLI